MLGTPVTHVLKRSSEWNQPHCTIKILLSFQTSTQGNETTYPREPRTIEQIRHHVYSRKGKLLEANTVFAVEAKKKDQERAMIDLKVNRATGNALSRLA